jgi:hypothetical protein
MVLLTTLGLIASAGSSINQFIQGEKMASSAKSGLDQFKYQDLTNLAASIKPSLEAERQLRIGTSEMLATTSDVAQGRDIAGALGLLGMGYQQAQKTQLQGLTSMLDKEFQADMLRLQEEQTIRQMKEARDLERLQSLKQQAMAGAQMKSDALSDVAMTAVSAGIAQEAALAEAGIDPRSVKDAKDAADAAEAAANATKTAKDVTDTAKLVEDLPLDSRLASKSFSAQLDNTFSSLQPRNTLYDPQVGLQGAINNSIINNMPPKYGVVFPNSKSSGGFMPGYFNFMNRNRRF